MASGDFNAGAGGLLGTNDLQQSIDTFKSAVDDLKSTVANLGTTMGSGMLRHPAMGMMAEGQTFTRGSLNGMAMGGNGSFLTSSQQRGAVILGQGQGGTPASSSPPPTMGQTAAGGGAIGGGATFGGRSSGGGGTGSSGGPGGSSPPPTMNQTAAGGGANGGGATFGGGPGGPSGPIGGPGGPGRGGLPPGFMGAAGAGAVGAFAAMGMGQYSNQLLFNAYGQQMAATWGYGAQSAQNNAFGNGNGMVNAAAAGNAQGAASEFTTLNAMAGGGAIGYGNALQAANAFAFTNQGLGAAGGAQLAASVYNPVNSLRMQMLTGVSSINPQSGRLNSMASVIGGLASQNYLGGGGYNSQTGTFRQSALNASFTPGRGTSYMNLSSLGYNPTQISDIQSMMSQANQAANKGHTSLQNVLGTMNSAEYGSENQIQSADARLKGWGVNLSTIQKQGNLSSLHMAQSQSQSSTFNEAISGATTAMTHFTQAVNYFLDKTGLNKAMGLGGGISAGMASTGLSGLMSGAGTMISSLGSLASMGGGAASVSTAQPMNSMGAKPGSSTSNVSGTVATAVRDAEAQVGKPYVYGGASPQSSFDCSGLVMWAYGQAGVHLPRTSQQQWAALKNKSVPVGQAQEGDIVFQAGSDGTAQAPGHEALMISSKQIVEAPYTGANIRIRAYNPNEWQHVGRPSGKGGGSSSTAVSGTQTGNTASALGAGNAGSGGSGDSDLGLTTDADSMLFSGGGTGGGGGGAMSTTTNGSAVSGSKNVSTAGGGSAAKNKLLAQKMAQQMYGWSGSEWTQGLDPLWTQESGFRSNAQNPTSTAYGIAQFLDSTWGPYGPKTSDPGLQIKYGLEYVHNRYGNPIHAEQHEKAYNWYGTGTRSAAPGLALVGDRGPELISLSGGQQIHNAQDTSNILQGKSALPAQSPWMASPAQQLLLDSLTPANNVHGSSGGVTVTITVEKGAFQVTGSGTGSSSDVQSMADAFGQAIENRLQKSELLRNIAKGNTG